MEYHPTHLPAGPTYAVNRLYSAKMAKNALFRTVFRVYNPWVHPKTKIFLPKSWVLVNEKISNFRKIEFSTLEEVFE